MQGSSIPSLKLDGVLCKIPLTRSNGYIHHPCIGPNRGRNSCMWRALWWFGCKLRSGRSVRTVCKYRVILCRYFSTWTGEVLWDVAHWIAVAKNMVLSSTCSKRATSLSWWSSRACCSKEAKETGKSNSIQERHWSAFSFPCLFSPRLTGGPSCQVGRIVFRISNWIWRTSFRVRSAVDLGGL